LLLLPLHSPLHLRHLRRHRLANLQIRHLQFPQQISSIPSSSGARFPLVFTCSASSISINSRAASGSITGSPVRGSAYAPSTIAALLPIIRTRFSNACNFFGASAAGAVVALASAAACATAFSFTSSRFSSRSCSSTTSLRISPSAVNGRRSTTLNPSSCLCSATVIFLCPQKFHSSLSREGNSPAASRPSPAGCTQIPCIPYNPPCTKSPYQPARSRQYLWYQRL